jgi:hypothetical protein
MMGHRSAWYPSSPRELLGSHPGRQGLGKRVAEHWPAALRFRIEAPAFAGTDLIITRDGRIAALYLFFDKLP